MTKGATPTIYSKNFYVDPHSEIMYTYLMTTKFYEFDYDNYLRSTQERLRNLSVVKKNGCIEWTGAKNPRGYGRIILKTKGSRAKEMLVRRLVWEIKNNTCLERSEYLLPSCDNSFCINPDHLFLSHSS